MTHSPSHTALAWREISDGAPSETLVLVYGNAPVRFGYRDALGNWRAKHHGPLRTPPTHWMLLPPPPGTEPPQSINSELLEAAKKVRGLLVRDSAAFERGTKKPDPKTFVGKSILMLDTAISNAEKAI